MKLPEQEILPSIGKRIAFGWDSEVWSDGRFVWKIYSDISKQQLELYKNITDRAIDFLTIHSFQPYISETHRLEITRIIPIQEIFQIKEGNALRWCAKSEYVSGPNGIAFHEDFPSFFSESEELNRYLGVQGIEIIDWNVKVINNSQIWITDLCPNIGMLRKK